MTDVCVTMCDIIGLQCICLIQKIGAERSYTRLKSNSGMNALQAEDSEG